MTSTQWKTSLKFIGKPRGNLDCHTPCQTSIRPQTHHTFHFPFYAVCCLHTWLCPSGVCNYKISHQRQLEQICDTLRWLCAPPPVTMSCIFWVCNSCTSTCIRVIYGVYKDWIFKKSSDFEYSVVVIKFSTFLSNFKLVTNKIWGKTII